MEHCQRQNGCPSHTGAPFAEKEAYLALKHAFADYADASQEILPESILIECARVMRRARHEYLPHIVEIAERSAPRRRKPCCRCCSCPDDPLSDEDEPLVSRATQSSDNLQRGDGPASTEDALAAETRAAEAARRLEEAQVIGCG